MPKSSDDDLVNVDIDAALEKQKRDKNKQRLS